MKFARCRHNESGREVQVVVRETALHVIQGDLFEDWRETGEIYPLSEVTLLAPLQPNSIIGIGQNYISAGMERPERLPDIPLFFHKPVSSLIGHEDKIEIPVGLDYLKFECELAVVIGRKGKHIPIKHAPEYIFGYTIGNDVSATQLTHPDGHWMLVKSGDTFTPLGPYIETELDPYDVLIQSQLNGEMRQQGHTGQMIYPIIGIISYLSQYMTLQPGDVILTGTPDGVDLMRSGDTITCSISGIGCLNNCVVSARSI